MNAAPIGRDEVLARFGEHDLRALTLELAHGGTLVVSERGGRLLPFFADQRSALWLSPALADAERFAAFLDRDDWNLGGERIWIAPEIQFTVRDRRDFWGSYALPKAMDPGTWTLESLGERGCALRQELELRAHNLATGVKRLAVERRVRAVPDPLERARSDLGDLSEVAFHGFEHDVVLRDLGPTEIGAQAWNLIQLEPGGVVVLPTVAPAQQRDYFEPVGERQRLGPDCVELSITGEHRYKVGYRARHHLGRLAYARRLDSRAACLIVRSFFNNPSSRYLEEPADRPGEHGDSVHVYNDDGNAGGFGEIECYGQALGGRSGRTSSADTTVLWIYAGPVGAIADVARALLGEVAARRVATRLGASSRG